MVKYVKSKNIDSKVMNELTNLTRELFAPPYGRGLYSVRANNQIINLILGENLLAISARPGLNEVDVYHPRFRSDAQMLTELCEDTARIGIWTLRELYPPQD